MKLRLIAFVALMSACSAASAKKFVAPPTPVAQQLPVEVVLTQHEMAVVVPDTATRVGMQFGLIGALVGAAVQQAQVSNAEKRVAEIRNLLVDYRFNERMEAALRARVPSQGLSPEPQFTFMANPWDATTAIQAGQKSRKGVFVIVPFYSLQSDFEQMTIALRVSIVDRTVKPNGKIKDKPTYYRNYTWRIPLAKVSGSGATEDSQRWLALGSAGLSSLLDEGIDQVVSMMVYDFSTEGRLESGESIVAATAYLHGTPYRGREVKKDANWMWVRQKDPVGALTLFGYRPIGDTLASSTTAGPTQLIDASPAPATVAPSAPAAPAAAEPAPAPTAPATGAGAR